MHLENQHRPSFQILSRPLREWHSVIPRDVGRKISVNAPALALTQSATGQFLRSGYQHQDMMDYFSVAWLDHRGPQPGIGGDWRLDRNVAVIENPAGGHLLGFGKFHNKIRLAEWPILPRRGVGPPADRKKKRLKSRYRSN